MHQRVHRLERQTDDKGQAMVLVLVISAMLVASLVMTLASARAGISQSIGFKAGFQGEMAAQTGLATELTAMRNASSYSTLPCSLTGSLGVTGATSTYTTTVAYSANGTALTCTGSGSTLGGSTAPTNATLTSTGKAPYGSTAVMKEDVTIAVSASSGPALGYAIFTSNDLDLENAAVLSTGTSVPNIYAGAQLTCANGTTSTGSVITYDSVDLTGSCSFSGSLTSASYVEMGNSAGVAGNVVSYGGNSTCAGICLSGSATIGGTATEYAGNIAVPNGTITGNAYASGTISVSGGGKIKGTQTPNDTSLSGTMPAADTFPSLQLPTTGWNIVSIPNSSYTCAQYFQSINNEASGTTVANPDPFQSALEDQVERTVYEAPTCSVTYSNAQVFALNPSPAGDAILDVASLTFNNSNTFCEESATNSGTCSSATTPGPNLTLFAGPTPPAPPTSPTCSTSTVDATFNNSSDFEPNVAVLVYSLGEVDYANAPSMTGQILACGGLTGTNAFALTFNPAASTEVFGSSGSALTVTIKDKYIAAG
jgi:hypothetical protein